MMKLFMTTLIALLATMTAACNLYEEGKPEITYLCKDQICDKQTITNGNQCQSGCCWEGKCNADGKCAEQQLTWAVIAIAVIGVVGALIFTAVWWFYLRHVTAKREKMLAAKK